jgi:hypothetical protein
LLTRYIQEKLQHIRVLRSIGDLKEERMAICGAKIRGKLEWCQEEGTEAYGRCPKHVGRSLSNARAAKRRYAAKEAAGEPKRFYTATKKTSKAQAFWAGKRLSEAHRANIAAAQRDGHQERRSEKKADREIAKVNELCHIRAPAIEFGGAQ